MTRHRTVTRERGRIRTPGTDTCPVCDTKYDEHPMCDACDALIGRGHEETHIIVFRGKKLCGHCHYRWEDNDKLLGRETTWTELTGGLRINDNPIKKRR